MNNCHCFLFTSFYCFFNLDLNKLCYDFTCVHSGICTSNDKDGPTCDCTDTGYTGERCDKCKCSFSIKKCLRFSFDVVPNGFYFGKSNSIGFLEYVLSQSRQTEQDTISFGLQTLSMSAQIFRLESDVASYSLEYEIVSLFLFHVWKR